MEKNLKKIGVLFLVLTAVMFGALIGLLERSPLVSITTLVVIAACLIIAHFLITKKLDIPEHKPIELLIILFADIVFGLFAGSIFSDGNPFLQIITASMIGICGLIAFYILFIKPRQDPITFS